MNRGRTWVTTVALLSVAPGAAALDILSSKHNFQLQTNEVRVAVGTLEDGICVFCHTPHKGASSLLLWNHQLSANNYGWEDVTNGKTTGGTSYPTNLRTWSGSTAKCLSCHDGTVSVGAIYWSNATANPRVTMAGADVDPDGSIGNATYIIPDAATGTDLRGNHPVGVPYSYGNVASTYNGISTGPDVRLNEWVGQPTGVKIFGAGGGGAPLNGAAGIECASCHDPHGTGNTFFLRIPKAGSRLCLGCHVK
ncbi:MAG TPA: cytochrome c3 family protein [Anaeromyxobacter sp.]|nr:cytochrome c3 family protein [Anaeromyxobacter sp.]